MTYDISSQLLPPLHLKPSSKLRLHCRQDLTNSTLAKLPVTMARATLRRFMRIQWRAGRPIAWRTYCSQNISRQHKCSMMADCLGRPQDDDGMFKRKNEVTPKQGSAWFDLKSCAVCPSVSPWRHIGDPMRRDCPSTLLQRARRKRRSSREARPLGKQPWTTELGTVGEMFYDVLWCFVMFFCFPKQDVWRPWRIWRMPSDHSWPPGVSRKLAVGLPGSKVDGLYFCGEDRMVKATLTFS